MGSVSRGIRLGGAVRAFNAAQERDIQREGIQAERDIAAGRQVGQNQRVTAQQAGQNQRQQAGFDEEKRKLFVDNTKAAFSGLRDKVNDLTASITSETSTVQAAEIVRERDMTIKGMEQMLSGVAPTRTINGVPHQNPNYSPGVFSVLTQQIADAKRAFNLAGRKAQAAAVQKGQAALTTAKAGGAAAGALEAKAKRAPKNVNILRADGTSEIGDLNDPAFTSTLREGDKIIGLTVQATDIGGLTKGAATKQQTNEINLTNVTTELAGAQQLITKSTNAFGFMGAFNEDFLNKTVAQFAPDLFNREVGVVRTFFRAMRETALRVASADDRFNKDDIERIGNLFPKDGVFESKPNALLKTQQLRLMFLNRLSLVRGKLGIENKTERLTGVQMAAAVTLSFGALRDATNKGQFTKAQFLQIVDIFHNDVLQAAKRSRGGQ